MNTSRIAMIGVLICTFISGATGQRHDSLRAGNTPRRVLYVDRGARTAFVVGGLVGVGFQMRAVYARSPGWQYLEPFHIQRSAHPFFRQDKAGHAFTGYALHTVLTPAFEWAGWNRKTAGVFAFGGVLMLRGYGEYLEGRLPNTGYDVGDNIADALGAGLGMLQAFIPELNRVMLKWSFVPDFAAYDGRHPWIQDQPNQKYHFFVNVWRGLGPTIGVSSTSWEGQPGKLVLTLSFDYDLRLLDPESPWLRILNLVKLPTPGIKFSPDGVQFQLICWMR